MSPEHADTQEASERSIANMFNRLAPRYDFLNRLLSAGQDQRWRKTLIRRLEFKSEQAVYLDVATGTGDLLLLAEKLHPQVQLIGVDISTSMLEKAETKVQKKKKHPDSYFEFRLMSATDLHFKDQSIDCLSISFGLRNVVDKEKAISEFYRVLKPGGKLLILEFFKSSHNIGHQLFQKYFHRILPRIGGLFSDKSAYEYLPKSVEGFYSVEQLQGKLRELSFEPTFIKRFLFGACALIEVKKI